MNNRASYLAAIFLIFISFPAYANNIFFPPVFIIYLAPVFYPYAALAVLVLETAVYCFFLRDISFKKIILMVLVANIASMFSGIFLSIFIPFYRTPASMRVLTVSMFIAACLLSIVVEWLVLRWFARKIRIENPYRISLYSNAASYLMLSIIILCHGFGEL